MMKPIPTSTPQERVTLFRGIAVPPANIDHVSAEIWEHGLRKVKGMLWGSQMASPSAVRGRVAELMASPSTIRARIDEMPMGHLICACGDEFGATHYAVGRLPIGDISRGLLITFSAGLNELSIDGKDFLYTIFQFWDRDRKHDRELFRERLAMMFGTGILKYFDLASETDKTIERVGICDLACIDLNVIREHLRNMVLINGRCNTRFCSAVQMQEPVTSAQIISVTTVHSLPGAPERQIHLDSLLH